VKLAIVFERTAGNELREQLARLAKTNPDLARALSNDLGTSLDLISQFPGLYARYDGNLRRAVLPRRSLGIFYEPTPQAILLRRSSTSDAIPLPSGAGLGYMSTPRISFQVQPCHSRQAYPLVPTFA
jgi:plasmid stabilization system protein ParE